MTDPTPILRCIFGGDLSACLLLADFFEERGDRRASLLRRRYAMYQRAVSAGGVARAQGVALLCLPADTHSRIREYMLASIASGRFAELHCKAEAESLQQYVSRKFVREARGRLT